MQNDAISRSEEQYPIDGEELFNRMQNLKHYEVRRNPFDETGIYEVFKCQDVLDAILASDRLDVAPVVRCKDCKHALSTTGECVKCTIWREWMPNDGFCSEGGRSV